MSSNQKLSQMVVVPGAKFDSNQIATPIGLFNQDGTEFVGGEGVAGSGWQVAPPYQNMVMAVSDIAETDLDFLVDGHANSLDAGGHIYVYDGSSSKVYTTTGAGLAMVVDDESQPKVGDVFFSNVFVDSTSDPMVQSENLRIWYNSNDNGTEAPHYVVLEGEVKQALDTGITVFVNDICNIDATDDIIIGCVTNADQPSNTFYFNRIDDGVYSATLAGVTVNGDPSPEVPFGFSVLKDLAGDGSNYRWVQGGAGLPTVTLGVGAGASPSAVDLVGSDHSGMITFTTGTGGIVGEILEVTLANAIDAKFVVELSAANLNALGFIGQIICSPDLIDGENWSISTTSTELDDATEYSFFYTIHKFYN